MPALSRDDLTPEGQAIFDRFRVFRLWRDVNDDRTIRFLIMRREGDHEHDTYHGIALKMTEKAANKEMARRRYWACWKYRKP